MPDPGAPGADREERVCWQENKSREPIDPPTCSSCQGTPAAASEIAQPSSPTATFHVAGSDPSGLAKVLVNNNSYLGDAYVLFFWLLRIFSITLERTLAEKFLERLLSPRGEVGRGGSVLHDVSVQNYLLHAFFIDFDILLNFR